MIENLQGKLHQRKLKQSRGAKTCANIKWELECEKCSSTYCKIIGRQNIQNQNNAKYFSDPEDIFNPHTHKMGPWGPKQYIFGDYFCWQNVRKLRFHILLHITARKHDIIILPEAEQIHKKLWICTNLVEVPGDP